MTWNDVVSNVRQAFRRGLGRVSGKQVRLARPGTRLEQLAEAPLDTPPIDVYENDREILIRADVPGGNGDRATVVWDEARGLTFLVKTASLPAGTLWASDHSPCDWYRALELPDYVEGSKATAALKEGVLTIRLPKRASGRSKAIPVRTG